MRRRPNSLLFMLKSALRRQMMRISSASIVSTFFGMDASVIRSYAGGEKPNSIGIERSVESMSASRSSYEAEMCKEKSSAEGSEAVFTFWRCHPRWWFSRVMMVGPIGFCFTTSGISKWDIRSSAGCSQFHDAGGFHVPARI